MGLEHAQVAKPAGNQAQALLRHGLGIVDVAVLFGVVAQTLARPGEHALQRGSGAVGCGREVVVVGERARCSLPLRSAEHAAVAPCLTVARERGRGREGSRPRVLDMSDSSDPQAGGRKRFKRRICADQRGSGAAAIAAKSMGAGLAQGRPQLSASKSRFCRHHGQGPAARRRSHVCFLVRPRRRQLR